MAVASVVVCGPAELSSSRLKKRTTVAEMRPLGRDLRNCHHRDEACGAPNPRSRRCWTLIFLSHLNSYNNRRNEDPGGRDPRNSRRFGTLISSSCPQSENNHGNEAPWGHIFRRRNNDSGHPSMSPLKGRSPRLLLVRTTLKRRVLVFKSFLLSNLSIVSLLVAIFNNNLRISINTGISIGTNHSTSSFLKV